MEIPIPSKTTTLDFQGRSDGTCTDREERSYRIEQERNNEGHPSSSNTETFSVVIIKI